MTTGVAIYTRISQADPTQQTATRRQEAACRSYASAREWAVTDVFTDVDRSAYSQVERPGYERMLEDVAAGQFGGVLVWKLDRLMRRPAEFERFWSTCERAGAVLASVTEPLDTSTELGLAIVRILMVFATLESATKGVRLTAKFREMAHAGVPPTPNRAAFGLDPTWTAVVPEQAALIREAASRVVRGETLRGIVDDWNRRGERTPRGAHWFSSQLRKILENPYLVGDRRYKGEVVARGSWPAILDRQTFDALSDILHSRRREISYRRRYELTGLLRCVRCGGRIAGSNRSRGKGSPRVATYRCEPPPYGCTVTASLAEPLEAWVAERLFCYLDTPDLAATVATAIDVAPRPAEIGRLQAQLLQLARDHYQDRTFDRSHYAKVRSGLLTKLERAESEVHRRTQFPVLARLAGKGARLRREWPAADLAQRREVLMAAIDRIDVHPARKGDNRFQPQRFAITWNA